MRHRVAKKKLSRDTGHRKALLRNLSRALILEGRIETTLPKAKFVKPYVEKLVTKAKKGSDFNNLNLVNSKLRSKSALRKLFNDIAPSYAKRAGGYTRITKLGFRDGDNAPLARLEWVAEPKKSTKPAKTAKSAKSEQPAKEKESKEND